MAGGTSGKHAGPENKEGNEAKIFDITNKHYATFKDIVGGVNCGSFSYDNKKVAIGC